jgi:hypothetical protein
MTDDSSRSLIARPWTHAHEEDSGGAQVFRPSTHAFPRSRGRTSLDLKPDGTLERVAPGPDDRRARSGGTWEQQGQVLIVRAQSGAETRYQIESLDADRLIVRPI